MQYCRSQNKQTQWKSILEENGARETPGRFRVLTAFDEVLSSIPSTHVKQLTGTVTPDPGDLSPSSDLHRYLHTCGHTHRHTQTNRSKISRRLKMDWSSRFIAVSPTQSSDITPLLHCVRLCLKIDWSLPFIAVLPPLFWHYFSSVLGQHPFWPFFKNQQPFCCMSFVSVLKIHLFKNRTKLVTQKPIVKSYPGKES